jgi:hypothetical protein
MISLGTRWIAAFKFEKNLADADFTLNVTGSN